MLSQISKDRISALGYFTGTLVVMFSVESLALSSIISALSKNALKIGSASVLNPIPIVGSLATRAFIIIGAAVVFYGIIKLTAPWVVKGYQLSHIDLSSWRWTNIRSHFTKD